MQGAGALREAVRTEQRTLRGPLIAAPKGVCPIARQASSSGGNRTITDRITSTTTSATRKKSPFDNP